MAATPATIEQLARDVALSVDPENALRAMSALRAELDLLEPELVTRAVRTGASWSQVARALGVTKQAAHKKHRHAAVRGPHTGPGGPKILVTGEARRSIQLAREEARALGQSAVGTEHILLGILRCDASHAVRALNALGVTLAAARDCLQPTIVAPPAGAGAAAGEPSDAGITPHARRILEGSLREAVKRQEGYIGVEHLLLALLADSRNGATQTLEALRTTPSQIRRQLEREWEALSAGSAEALTTREAPPREPAMAPGGEVGQPAAQTASDAAAAEAARLRGQAPAG